MKFSNIFFYSVIGLQVIVALFAIRKWPLTDYPMFSFPREEFKFISRLYIEEIYPDHVYEWSQNDYHFIGAHAPRLQALMATPEHPDIEKFLKLAVQQFSVLKKQNPPQALRLNKRTFFQQPDGQIIETQELLREIPYAQLSE